MFDHGVYDIEYMIYSTWHRGVCIDWGLTLGSPYEESYHSGSIFGAPDF